MSIFSSIGNFVGNALKGTGIPVVSQLGGALAGVTGGAKTGTPVPAVQYYPGTTIPMPSGSVLPVNFAGYNNGPTIPPASTASSYIMPMMFALVAIVIVLLLLKRR